QFLVVEIDGEPVAFSESVLVDSRGDIQWLHVAAMYRGEGIGDRLFKATKERLEEGGAETIRGIVIADNNEGNTFYERRGLVKVDETTVEIDGTPFRENIYVDEEQTSVPTIEGAEGQTLYVDKTDADRGSKGAIYTVYTDGRQENRYGYYCGACESIVTAMDTMGAIECDSCGNRVKPTRWDAAYM
ncbi:MAG: GNAT family N-acetyltransferase, partial [Natronomonas sp.]